MTDAELSQYEGFLLNGPESVLSKTIKGTDSYYYFKYIQLLNEEHYNLTDEQKKELSDYAKFQNARSRDIRFRHLLLQYDQARQEGNLENVKEVLSQISKQYINLNFDFAQPSHVQTGSSLAGQQEEKPSVLDQKLIDISTFLERSYSDLKAIQVLTPELLRQLDISRLYSATPEIQYHYIQNMGRYLSEQKGVPDFLKNYQDLHKKTSKDFELPGEIFRNLTLQQLEDLGRLIPSLNNNQEFIGELYVKKFNFRFSDTPSSPEEKAIRLSQLKEIYDWALKLAPKFESFSDQILYEILQVGYETNDYDFNLFLKYLENPKSNYSGTNQKHQQNLNKRNKSYQNIWHKFHTLNVNRWLGDTQLIEKYLAKYFDTSDDYSIFEPYLDKEYLVKQLSVVKLLKGQDVPNIIEVFNSAQLKVMNDEKLIQIESFNKKRFQRGEQVSLSVVLKNINQLTIKVFEVCTENYLLKNFAPVNDSINLDGLIASEQTEHVFNYPPVVKNTKEFTFEKLTAKDKGVFIIEFIGNGITSRAIIRKGRLVLREKQTVAGHVFQILDENLEVCAGRRSGMWINKRFYSVDANKEIIVPYVTSKQHQNVVIVHDDFADLGVVTILPEIFYFDCAYLYSTESMLMSSKAKILIKPRLQINLIPASLELISQPQVVVTTVNDSDIPSTMTFDKIKFNRNEELEIEFPIAAKLKQITIQVNVKLLKLHKEGVEQFQNASSNHQIQFENYIGKRIFCAQFLKYNQENGYEIHLLGRNGEPKPGVNLVMSLRINDCNEAQSVYLVTDGEGKVVLGELKNVYQVVSFVQPKGDIQAEPSTWDLTNNFKVQYPNSLMLVKNDTLKLPFLHKELTYSNVSFYHMAYSEKRGTQSIQNNVRDKLTLVDGQLIIENLDIGEYVLNIYDPLQVIDIKVVEGNYYGNLIYTQDQLLDQKVTLNPIVLKNVALDHNEQEVTIKARYSSQNNQNIRVHAAAVQFLPNTIDQLARNLFSSTLIQEPTAINIFKPQNSYLSNKRLSDEQKYVLDRKNQERYVGNTLEKPQFLLKRQYIRDTDVTKEELQQEGDFQSVNQKADAQQAINLRCKEKDARLNARRAAGQQNVNSFLNFLQNPALLLSNQRLDDDGTVTITVPNHTYQTVLLIATNNDEVHFEVIPLRRIPINTRDLSQKSSMKSDKFYSIFRSQQIVNKDATVQFEDLTSTELQIVDSSEKMFTLLKELRKCHGGDSEQVGGFDYWEFLKRWEGLDFDEKHKLFDKHQCDELNIFIFFKDRAYFETYVKEYIANKIEKTFVDYFLALNRQKLIVYSQPQNIGRLNALEQALLVIYFAELSTDESDKEIAKEVYNAMEAENRLIPVDQRNYKRLFDTILDAKTQEGFATTTETLRAETQPMIMKNSQMFNAPVQMVMARNMMPTQPQARQVRMMARPEKEMKMKSDRAFLQQESAQDLLDFSDRDDSRYLQIRKQFQQDFQNVEKTKEYGEKHYAKTTNLQQFKQLVPLNGFWVDVAKHSIERGIFNSPFLSSKFIFCNQNHTQMIAVLALSDVPFAAASHQYNPFQGKGMQIVAGSPALIFTKEIKEGDADLKVDILVAQRFFDPKDRYVYQDDDPNIKIEKDLAECTINRVYGGQVIVTNCTISRFDFQVLVEVPEGSIPVETVDYTRNHNITLDPYTTTTIEYYFYFPKEGKFSVQPANVSRSGRVVAVAKPSVFTVNRELTKTNLETMDEILSKGSKADILNFISTKNILNNYLFKFSDIYYLLKDREFYLQLVEVLRKKKVFDYTTWTFAFYHGDHQTLVELFNSDRFASVIGGFKYFKCSLFEQVGIRFVEYHPLITQRVHQLSQDRTNILNVQFKAQYTNFIHYLVQKRVHDLSDKLVFIYYLLLQERINEAIQVYKSIDQDKLPASGEALLQFDYFTAYLDFYIGFPTFTKARQVCEKYLDCPAIHWRNLFYEIVNQLCEYDGEEVSDQVKQKLQTDKKLKNQEQADKEEVLTLTLETNTIILQHTNLSEATISIYKIDLEVLFSRNPFISQGSEDFAFVQPNHVFVEKLNSDPNTNQGRTPIEIPPEFQSHNVFIQVSAGEKRAQSTYFSTSLKVEVLENFGQVKVQDKNGKFLSKIYVKTFAKQNNGSVIFYKDGYTDLRGRLDYASLDADSQKNVERFAIFISSDEHGSLIYETKAPVQTGKQEQEVKLISASWNQKKELTRAMQKATYLEHESNFMRKKY